MSGKKIFAFWSGGLDSTAMIWKLLGDGYHVTAGYVELVANHQTNREAAAIERMAPFLERYKFTNLGKIATVRPFQISEQLILEQASAWVSSLMFVPNHDVVALGYVMGDDACSFIPEVKKAINGVSALRRTPVKPVFPVIQMSKPELWEGLPSDLRDHVTWCSSENDLCGECPSCRKMIYYGLQPKPLPKVRDAL